MPFAVCEISGVIVALKNMGTQTKMAIHVVNRCSVHFQEQLSYSIHVVVFIYTDSDLACDSVSD